MNLRHYSAAPFTFNPAQRYEQTRYYKPTGLWVSDDDGDPGWPEWCQNEDFRKPGLAHATDFRFVEDANVLHLGSVGDIVSFTRRWQVPLYVGARMDAIDWPRVTLEYDGILITPYQWQCRLHYGTFWYYTWDCASACIWNLNAVSIVQEVTA